MLPVFFFLRNVDHAHRRLLEDAGGFFVEAARPRRAPHDEGIQSHLDVLTECIVDLLQRFLSKVFAPRSFVAEPKGELHRSRCSGSNEE
jgi:hypothetical protein